MEDANKEVVRRFNREVIRDGSLDAFSELMAQDFVNRSAPSGGANGPESMWDTFQNVLRPALAELDVVIHEQIAEGDLVTTRKSITGTHSGMFLGIPPTGRAVTIDVIDIVRIRDGRYCEHWGMNTLPAVLAMLRQG